MSKPTVVKGREERKVSWVNLSLFDLHADFDIESKLSSL